MTTGLPSGIVTFLFTDIEDSTGLLLRLGSAFADLLGVHGRLVGEVIEAHGGHVLRTEGDAFVAAFQRPSAGIAAALQAQRRLVEHPWPESARLAVRMGLHTGEVAIVGGDYVGLAIHHAQRVSAVAHGGQILVSSATKMLGVLPDGARLRSVGRVSLKGFEEPDELFQLEHPSLPDAFPPPGSVQVASNLPTFLSSFVGRDPDKAALEDHIAGSRLVTIVGPGGVGKTRLAVEVARRLAPRFEGGAWMVDLAPVDAPDLVLPTVLATLSVPQPDARELAARIRERETMVLLDNCEHLIEAAADATAWLLGNSSHLRVLATSRERLGIGGEIAYRLSPMEDDAVTLFIERARSHDAHFSGSDGEGIGEICRLVDGLPLGIELAAAHVGSMTCRDIARRLGSDRFAVLNTGLRDGAERQRTMESTVAWGFDLLTEPQRLLLTRLGVFTGGFTAAAAQAVCSGDGVDAEDVPGLLKALVDRSLIVWRPRGHGSRYWMLETIREYGWNHLSGSDPGGARWLFRRDGDGWTIGSPEAPVLVRDSRGMHHLAILLRSPGREIHALELHGVPRDLASGGDDMIDPQARRAYEQRIRDLDAEIEEAEGFHDVGRAEKARAEQSRLVEELGRALGLGGRSRRAGSSAERARAAVTKAIRASIAHLDAVAPVVGSHLREAIRTGTYCRYEGGRDWVL